MACAVFPCLSIDMYLRHSFHYMLNIVTNINPITTASIHKSDKRQLPWKSISTIFVVINGIKMRLLTDECKDIITNMENQYTFCAVKLN